MPQADSVADRRGSAEAGEASAERRGGGRERKVSSVRAGRQALCQGRTWLCSHGSSIGKEETRPAREERELDRGGLEWEGGGRDFFHLQRAP
eukprot:3937217-Rhodomonas_salina.1